MGKDLKKIFINGEEGEDQEARGRHWQNIASASQILGIAWSEGRCYTLTKQSISLLDTEEGTMKPLCDLEREVKTKGFNCKGMDALGGFLYFANIEDNKVYKF